MSQSKLKQVLNALVAILSVAAVFLIAAIVLALFIVAGIVSGGIPGAVIGGFLYLVGVISLETAKMIFLVFAVIGAVLSVVIRGIGTLITLLDQ